MVCFSLVYALCTVCLGLFGLFALSLGVIGRLYYVLATQRIFYTFFFCACSLHNAKYVLFRLLSYCSDVWMLSSKDLVGEENAASPI